MHKIYYTCMNYCMQVGLLQDLLHLRELVNGNDAFISDRRVDTTPDLEVVTSRKLINSGQGGCNLVTCNHPIN